jgi:hypothetical protein
LQTCAQKLANEQRAEALAGAASKSQAVRDAEVTAHQQALRAAIATHAATTAAAETGLDDDDEDVDDSDEEAEADAAKADGAVGTKRKGATPATAAGDADADDAEAPAASDSDDDVPREF